IKRNIEYLLSTLFFIPSCLSMANKSDSNQSVSIPFSYMSRHAIILAISSVPKQHSNHKKSGMMNGHVRSFSHPNERISLMFENILTNKSREAKDKL